MKPAATTDEEVLAKVERHVGGLTQDVARLAPRRLTARTTPDRLVEVLRTLRDAVGCRHLSAISAVDTEQGIELIYHLSTGGVVVSVRTSVPRNAARIRTVTDVLPAANLYEREIHDLFGVEFEGHPDPRRLLLYEGWPEGQYPLRKDWKPESLGGPKDA